MRYPNISADSSLLFLTTAYANPAFGNSNLMIGAYPSYEFLLKKDWTVSATFGDLEVCVEVFPCHRTGDPILDSRSVRDTLLAAFARSNPDSSPSSMQRKETAGAIFQHVDPTSGDTSYYAMEAPTYSVRNQCQSDFNAFAGNDPSDQIVAAWHTHPNMPADTVYGCADPGAQQTPGGPGQPSMALNPRRFGGGSPPDWAKANSSDYDQYVMSATGMVAKLTPGTPVANRPSNQNVYYWKNNPNGCRGWSHPQ